MKSSNQRTVQQSTINSLWKQIATALTFFNSRKRWRLDMTRAMHTGSLNGELFSNYKKHTTLEGLIGISPGGAITFNSQLYTGSISDRKIVLRSGLLDLPFQEKDSIMADKGFTIQDLLPLGVSLNIPPFVGSSAQKPQQMMYFALKKLPVCACMLSEPLTKQKVWYIWENIWDGIAPLHQFGVVNQMWAVCAILCNAQSKSFLFKLFCVLTNWYFCHATL